MQNLLIIIGSAKCGTSSLAMWLDMHPAFTRGLNKEPRFFTDFSERNWSGPGSTGFVASQIATYKEYLSNFPDARPGMWAIDASTDYIWSDVSSGRIVDFSKNAGVNVKLIAIVRDPIDRAISEYNHTLRNNWEELSFGDALDAEAERISLGYNPLFYHIRRSTVLADITHYREVFGKDLLILDYADMENEEALLEKICAHTGADYFPVPRQPRNNESFLPRSELAKAILNNDMIRSISRKLLPKTVRQKTWQSLHVSSRQIETVTESEKKKLSEILRDEIDACITSPLIPTNNWKTR